MTDGDNPALRALRETHQQTEQTAARERIEARRSISMIIACGALALLGNVWCVYDGFVRHDWPRVAASLPVVGVVLVSLRMFWVLRRRWR